MYAAGSKAATQTKSGSNALQKHTHTTPNHTHTLKIENSYYKNAKSNGTWSTETCGALSGTGYKVSQIKSTDGFVYDVHGHDITQTSSGGSTTGTTGTGVDASSTEGNMPQYIVAYCWYRES